MKLLTFAALLLLPSSIFASAVHVDIATATWYSNTGACGEGLIPGAILTDCPIATFSASYDMDVSAVTVQGVTFQHGALRLDSVQFAASGMLSGISSFVQTSMYGSLRWNGGQEGLLTMLPSDWWGLPQANVLEPGVFSKGMLELRCNPCQDHIVGPGRESLYWNPGSGGIVTVTAIPEAQVPEPSPVLMLAVALPFLGALRRRLA